MESVIHDYLRPGKKLPHVWCPGCGYGIILSALTRAIDALKIDRNEIILVSGIGCSSRAPVYVDFGSLHGTHGRALAYATGVKMANPKLKVIVISGDGDSLAIGGNHFIHAARRNLDLTLLVFNNNIYGMTGGQNSPTMPTGAFGATVPYGNIERTFDVCDLAETAGATFVARTTVNQPFVIEKYMKQGIQHKGYSVLDIASPCPAIYSFFNKTGTGVQMMQEMKTRTIPRQKAESLSPQEHANKIITGIFVDKEVPEYAEKYQQLMEQAKRRKRDEELI